LARYTWQATPPQGGARIEYALFTRDHLGHITSMTRYQDPGAVAPSLGVKTQFSYDSLGHLIAQSLWDTQNPPNQLIPEKDSTFDHLGELLGTFWNVGDPDQQAVTYRYDALGRLTHSEETTGVMPPNTDLATVKDFAYDVGVSTPQVNPTYVLGRLARATSPTGDVYFSYDAFGRVNASTFTDPGETAY